MRVLLVAGQLVAPQMAIWREVARGGTELCVLGALRHVEAAGPWWQPQAPDWAPVRVVRPIGLPGRGQGWWYYPGLRRTVRELNPDVIHVAAEPWAVRVSQALRTGLPVVVHSADNMYTHGRRPAVFIRLRRLRSILPRLAGLVSWNSAGLALARRFGLPPSTPGLVAPAEILDPAAFRLAEDEREAVRAGLGLASDQVAIGFFGRLEPEKGPLLLARAFRRAVLPSGRLFLFGEGSLHDEVARVLGSGEGGRLMGPVGLDRLPAMVSAMDVVVVPSIPRPDVVEQFGRAAVEAMMAGSALIVSDCGALPEVVGEAALVVSQGSEEELAAALARLAGDQGLRAELARLGRERVAAVHDPVAIAEALVRLWEGVARARA